MGKAWIEYGCSMYGHAEQSPVMILGLPVGQWLSGIKSAFLTEFPLIVAAGHIDPAISPLAGASCQ